MIHNLWPTNILQISMDPRPWLGAAQEIIPDRSVIDSYAGVRPWATEFDLHHRDPWRDLAQTITEITADYLHDQGLQWQSLWISELWVNAQYQSQNHIVHNHPNSWYSGVFYLQCPPGSQRLLFVDPRSQASVSRLLGSSQTWALSPQEGDLLIWPSWLQHQTVSWSRQDFAEPRICVSWNCCAEPDRTG